MTRAVTGHSLVPAGAITGHRFYDQLDAESFGLAGSNADDLACQRYSCTSGYLVRMLFFHGRHRTGI